MRMIDTYSNELLEDIIKILQGYEIGAYPDEFKDIKVDVVIENGECYLENKYGARLHLNSIGQLECILKLPVSERTGSLTELKEWAESGEIMNLDDILYIFDYCMKTNNTMPKPTIKLFDSQVDPESKQIITNHYIEESKIEINSTGEVSAIIVGCRYKGNVNSHMNPIVLSHCHSGIQQAIRLSNNLSTCICKTINEMNVKKQS